MIKKADEALQDAIKARVAAGNEEAVRALQDLVRWVPEFGFCWPHSYKDILTPERLTEEMKLLNDNCPFATEAFTYALFGKEEGRTYLALLGAMARALGFEGLRDLERSR